jgi:hypothetical protein
MMVGPSSLGTRVWSLHSGRLDLGLFCQCPLGMCMALFVGLCRSHFCCFSPDIERWCWGGRSHTSSVPVVHRSMTCPVTSPRPPFVASSIASMDEQALGESPTSKESTSEAREGPVLVTLGSDGMLQRRLCRRGWCWPPAKC